MSYITSVAIECYIISVVQCISSIVKISSVSYTWNIYKMYIYTPNVSEVVMHTDVTIFVTLV